MAKANPPDAWTEEFEGLVPQVKQWFQEATTRYAVPSDGGCRAVAFYIMAFRHHEDDKHDDSREKAIEYGGLFLHHLEPQRRQLEPWISVYSRTQPVPYWLEHDQDMLSRINDPKAYGGRAT